MRARHSTNMHTIWSKPWNAKVVPKIKMFGWKALHGSIPVRANLAIRQLCEDAICPTCGEEMESVLHAL